MRTIFAIVLLAAAPLHAFMVSPLSPATTYTSSSLSAHCQRRAFIGTATAALLAPLPSLAFDNAIPDKAKYKDRPKQRGPKPSDLGVAPRGDNPDGLKTCSPGVNCFTTTGDEEFDRYYLIKPYKPSPSDAKNPIDAIASVIASYTPGQNGIDGGGFKIITNTPAYLYAQFESLKNTYIDDVEFALKDGGILVRSSSRLGYLDYGVNAKRLNYISERLRERGWEAAEITKKTHPDYFDQNAAK